MGKVACYWQIYIILETAEIVSHHWNVVKLVALLMLPYTGVRMLEWECVCVPVPG